VWRPGSWARYRRIEELFRKTAVLDLPISSWCRWW
jgi:hypothetical protein